MGALPGCRCVLPFATEITSVNYGSHLEKPSGDIINQLSFALWVYDDVMRMPRERVSLTLQFTPDRQLFDNL